MTAPQPPPDPLAALSPYDLSRYRRELEHALKALPGHAPARALLQQQLAGVMAETALPHPGPRQRTGVTTTGPGARQAAATGPARGRSFMPNGPGSCPSARTTAHPAGAPGTTPRPD